jgi:hypothetical protein
VRLAEVPARRISTAELEMHTAPAAAAAVGGIVVTRTEPPSSRNVMTKTGLW